MRPEYESEDWAAVARSVAYHGRTAEEIADELAERMKPDYCDNDGVLSTNAEINCANYAEELADQAIFDRDAVRDITETREEKRQSFLEHLADCDRDER